MNKYRSIYNRSFPFGEGKGSSLVIDSRVSLYYLWSSLATLFTCVHEASHLMARVPDWPEHGVAMQISQSSCN